MRRFILKTCLFVAPFALGYVLTISFYTTAETYDLMRIGLIPDLAGKTSDRFQEAFRRPFHFRPYAPGDTGKADVLIIGDSFSDQENYGYDNYLAESVNVLHLGRALSGNQMETLHGLINGGFFDREPVRYVVLECVERDFVRIGREMDTTRVIDRAALDSMWERQVRKKPNLGYKFFSSTTYKFPYEFIRYLTRHDYLSNGQTYNVDLTTDTLFSNGLDKLFFFHQDLDNTDLNNDGTAVQGLNDALNKLAHKLHDRGTGLIVLVAPDKYDAYYEFIREKQRFPRPLFFTLMDPLPKDYLYVDSKSLVTAGMGRHTDVYFPGDTHWSPFASVAVARAIADMVREQGGGGGQ
ncbi:MAG: hypothetical protein J5I62_00010 [Flavobacteriales bacterium]|nr:hypothetical protein [Flavobacteriales bacterium]MEB2340778.1 hypothetical protein [Flavobacteriia bacterium]